MADAARDLPTDEARAIVRQLVLDELVGGSATTVGELLDKIEQAAPAERRKMLDDARVGAGLPTTATVEGIRASEMASHAGRMKAGTDHRPMRLGYTDCGAIVDLNERDDDLARERAKAESLRRVREDRLAERAVGVRARAPRDPAAALGGGVAGGASVSALVSLLPCAGGSLGVTCPSGICSAKAGYPSGNAKRPAPGGRAASHSAMPAHSHGRA